VNQGCPGITPEHCGKALRANETEPEKQDRDSRKRREKMEILRCKPPPTPPGRPDGSLETGTQNGTDLHAVIMPPRLLRSKCWDKFSGVPTSCDYRKGILSPNLRALLTFGNESL
jgi:hypothetical protein